MLVNTYSPQSSRLLATSIASGAGSPTGSASPVGALVVEVGGGWHLSTWRGDLRKLAGRGAVAALALRTLPNEPRLRDREWAEITRVVAAQAGLADRPWAAVRTGATTVALLTDSTRGPLRVDDVRAFIRTISDPERGSDKPRTASRESVDGSIAAANGEGTAVHGAEASQPQSVAHLSFATSPAASTNTTTAAVSRPGTGPEHKPGTRPHPR